MSGAAREQRAGARARGHWTQGKTSNSSERRPTSPLPPLVRSLVRYRVALSLRARGAYPPRLEKRERTARVRVHCAARRPHWPASQSRLRAGGPRWPPPGLGAPAGLGACASAAALWHARETQLECCSPGSSATGASEGGRQHRSGVRLDSTACATRAPRHTCIAGRRAARGAGGAGSAGLGSGQHSVPQPGERGLPRRGRRRAQPAPGGRQPRGGGPQAPARARQGPRHRGAAPCRRPSG